MYGKHFMMDVIPGMCLNHRNESQLIKQNKELSSSADIRIQERFPNNDMWYNFLPSEPTADITLIWNYRCWHKKNYFLYHLGEIKAKKNKYK